MQIKAVKTRIFREHEELIPFILKYIKKLPEKSVLVITSKIVALSEGRTREIDLSIPHDKMREQIIRSESEYMLRTKYTWLTIKDGVVMSSAGIDESNADGKVILLPKNSFRAAADLRSAVGRKLRRGHRGNCRAYRVQSPRSGAATQRTGMAEGETAAGHHAGARRRSPARGVAARISRQSKIRTAAEARTGCFRDSREG